MTTPDTKPKTRQRQQHDDIWKLMVQACGSKCCVCGRSDLPLFRGHIERKKDGGADGLPNLIPICKSCNSEYNKALLTPDNRPADWRSNFIKLQIQYLNLRIQVKQQCTQGGQPQTTDNKNVISLDDLSFEPDFQLLTQVKIGTSALPTPEEIESATDELMDLGKSHRVPIPVPLARARDKMHKLARLHGVATFLAAGREFIEQEGWWESNGQYVKRLMQGSEWERFCDNFGLYVRNVKLRAQRREKQAEADREYRQRMDRLTFKQNAIATLERRIMNVSDLRGWKDELKRLKDTSVEVSLDELLPLLKDLDSQITQFENDPGPEAYLKDGAF